MRFLCRLRWENRLPCFQFHFLITFSFSFLLKELYVLVSNSDQQRLFLGFLQRLLTCFSFFLLDTATFSPFPVQHVTLSLCSTDSGSNPDSLAQPPRLYLAWSPLTSPVIAFLTSLTHSVLQILYFLSFPQISRSSFTCKLRFMLLLWPENQ